MSTRAANEPGAGKGHKAPEQQESATAPKTNDSGQPTHPTPTARQQRVEQRRKGMKGQAAAPKTSTNPAAPQAAAGAGAASSVPAAGQQNAGAGPRRRSRIRSRCNRSNRSTRTSVRSRSRSRFRQLPTIRIIGFKEANSGRVRNTKYSARIIRNGTIRAGITRITTVWS